MSPGFCVLLISGYLLFPQFFEEVVGTFSLASIVFLLLGPLLDMNPSVFINASLGI